MHPKALCEPMWYIEDNYWNNSFKTTSKMHKCELKLKYKNNIVLKLFIQRDNINIFMIS